jgi:hypothetical protein
VISGLEPGPRAVNPVRGTFITPAILLDIFLPLLATGMLASSSNDVISLSGELLRRGHHIRELALLNPPKLFVYKLRELCLQTGKNKDSLF